MTKKWSVTIVAISAVAGLLWLAPAYGDTTTVIQEATTKTVVPHHVVRHVKKNVVTETQTKVTVTKDATPRVPLDQDALKKLAPMLCVGGFKPYYGNEKRNVCAQKATAPDIAYSCVWDKKGEAVYPPTAQGPCRLDFAEHQGSILINKGVFASRPPLKYGTEAQCCFRAAKGPPVTTTNVNEEIKK